MTALSRLTIASVLSRIGTADPVEARAKSARRGWGL